MGIANLIEKVVGKQRERRASYAADFRGIVAKIADGKEPDVDAIDQVLHDAGKSIDDLTKAVELLQKRRKLRETLDRLPALQAERQEVDRQLNAAYEALEQAEQKHAEVTHPLRCRLEKLMDEMRDAEAAQRELDRTCSYEDLLAERAAVERQARHRPPRSLRPPQRRPGRPGTGQQRTPRRRAGEGDLAGRSPGRRVLATRQGARPRGSRLQSGDCEGGKKGRRLRA